MNLSMFITTYCCFITSEAVLRQPNVLLNNQWTNFKQEYTRNYKDLQEEQRRRLIFEDNYKFIKDHNSHANLSFTLAINYFSDMTHDEFRKDFIGTVAAGKQSDLSISCSCHLKDGKLPDKIDWREKGYVSSVRFQGRCRSCWAFTSAGAIEGQHYRSTGKFVILSAQHLIDCAILNGGCNGGNRDAAFSYVIRNKGIATEISYPYEQRNGKCFLNGTKIGAIISGYCFSSAGDEAALKRLVAQNGPVSVAVDTNSPSFRFYKEGIYEDSNCENSPEAINHAVLIVGYGTLNGKDYWLVKNSWGILWGIHGYMMLSRNANNLCGIATRPLLPLI